MGGDASPGSRWRRPAGGVAAEEDEARVAAAAARRARRRARAAAEGGRGRRGAGGGTLVPPSLLSTPTRRVWLRQRRGGSRRSANAAARSAARSTTSAPPPASSSRFTRRSTCRRASPPPTRRRAPRRTGGSPRPPPRPPPPPPRPRPTRPPTRPPPCAPRRRTRRARWRRTPAATTSSTLRASRARSSTARLDELEALEALQLHEERIRMAEARARGDFAMKEELARLAGVAAAAERAAAPDLEPDAHDARRRRRRGGGDGPRGAAAALAPRDEPADIAGAAAWQPLGSTSPLSSRGSSWKSSKPRCSSPLVGSRSGSLRRVVHGVGAEWASGVRGSVVRVEDITILRFAVGDRFLEARRTVRLPAENPGTRVCEAAAWLFVISSLGRGQSARVGAMDMGRVRDVQEFGDPRRRRLSERVHHASKKARPARRRPSIQRKWGENLDRTTRRPGGRRRRQPELHLTKLPFRACGRSPS